MMKAGMVSVLLVICLVSTATAQPSERPLVRAIRMFLSHFVDKVTDTVKGAVSGTHCFVDHAYCKDHSSQKPPEIHCPPTVTVTAPSRSTTAKASWSEPPGATRSGPAPGSIFKEGVTSVTYKKSANGMSNSCTVHVRVTVVRCPTPSAPLHGTRSCSTTQGRMVYGDKCTFSCGKGYYMAGSSTSTCLNNGKMSRSPPTCKPVPCGNPQQIKNGHFSCNGNAYGSVCHVVCDKYYTVDNKAKSISCQADRHWTKTGGCFDREPPKFSHCPKSKVYIADAGKTSTKVTWERVIATDPPTALTPTVKQTKGPVQGSTLNEGLHHIEYTAVDVAGNTVVHPCSFNVTVHVVQCLIPPAPLNGTKSCNITNGRLIYGHKCTFSCDRGYYMVGSSTSTCSRQAKMTSSVPSCKPVPCGNPQQIDNGHFSCNGNTYGSVCHVVCDKYYTVDDKAKSITCQADRHWSRTRGCLDRKPPQFHHCPSSKIIFAERGGILARVTWSSVTAIDPPTALTPTVIQTSGPRLGSTVPEGQHLIQFTAEDAAGNLAKELCSFNVTVTVTRCLPPHLDTTNVLHYSCPNGQHSHLDTTNLLHYTCPNGHTYGSECHMTCRHGNLAGPKKIVCEKDNSFPPQVRWKWDDSVGMKPYCQVRRCPALRAPRGGAIVCDGWQHGETCQMQCQRGFTFPATAPQNGTYKCGENCKIWFPNSNVPDCLATRTFYSVSMAATFYYDGHCDQKNSLQVRENFLTTLRITKFGIEMCKDVLACQTGNVQVTCGSKMTTKREQRETVRIKVTFTFPFRLHGNETTGEGRKTFRNRIISGLTSPAVTRMMDLQTLGLTLENQMTSFGELIPECQKGERKLNDGCAGCGPGYVVNEVSGSCDPCPVGYYQDQDSAPRCQPCPLGHTTVTSAASSFQECKAECSPGHYSETGLSPCFPCPTGSYQPHPRATHCLRCPPATLTSSAGSIKHCQAYDVRIAPHGDALFKQLSRDLTEWTFSVWFKLDQTPDGSVMLALLASEYEQKLIYLSLANTTMRMYIRGNITNGGSISLRPTWNHCVLTASSKTGVIQAYINGQTVLLTTAASGLTIPRSSRMHILGDDTGVTVTGVTIHDYVLQETEIRRLATSHQSDETPRELDLDSLNHEISTGIDIIFPSLCKM